MSIWAGTHGKLDDVPVDDVLRFESELLEHLRRNTDVLSTIAQTNDFNKDTESALGDAIDAFRNQFIKGDGEALVDAEAEEEATAEVEQEKIVRSKKA